MQPHGSTLKKWNKCDPAHKTWNNFKTTFRLAQRNLCKNDQLTAQNTMNHTELTNIVSEVVKQAMKTEIANIVNENDHTLQAQISEMKDMMEQLKINNKALLAKEKGYDVFSAFHPLDIFFIISC